MFGGKNRSSSSEKNNGPVSLCSKQEYRTFPTEELHDSYRSRSVVTIGDNDGLDV